MQKHNSEQLGDVLQQWLRQEGLETPLLRHRMISSWGDVMGPGIARYTGKVEIRGDRLFVEIKSAALRANLALMRMDIAKRLNDHVGAQIITDISFC